MPLFDLTDFLYFSKKFLTEINVYLSFNGQGEVAMNYYKDALHGEIGHIMRFSDAPMPSGEDEKNRVMHGVLKAGQTSIFFSDSMGGRPVANGDNFHISLSFGHEEEVDSIFNKLAEGGAVTMPLQDMFWNARFGMCKDKFGVHWMFNQDKPKTE
jgi:PhnB protein